MYKQTQLIVILIAGFLQGAQAFAKKPRVPILICEAFQEIGNITFSLDPKLLLKPGEFHLRIDANKVNINTLTFLNGNNEVIETWPGLALARRSLGTDNASFQSLEGPLQLSVGSADGVWNFASLTENGAEEGQKITFYFSCTKAN